MKLSAEQMMWTREALDRLYDPAFLHVHVAAACVAGRFADGMSARDALLDAIRQLKPPPETRTSSLAWRLYNALDARYVRGLTQAEAADELNISLRQLRREQDRGIESVAALLFGQQVSLASTPVPANPPRPEYAHFEESFHSAVSTLQPLFHQHGLMINVDFPTSRLLIHADRALVRQLLILALTWAAQGLAHATLDLSIQTDAGRIVITLTNPCAENASTELDAILHVAKMAQVEAGVSPDGRTLRIALPASERRCVLMVDDNPDAISLARRYLETSDQFELVAVTQPEAALAEAAALQPDCILLDVMMPVRDGWELLALLKSNAMTASIPVVVSSVVGSQALARALGAAGVLAQPYTAAQLIHALSAVIPPSPQAQAA